MRKGKATASEAVLHEALLGMGFKQRDLLATTKETGLLHLTKEGEKYRCYSCTLCERTCPVDCIDIRYCPSSPEAAFDSQAALEKTQASAPPIDKKLLDPVIASIRAGSGLVEALHAIQGSYGYLPRTALEAVAEEMQLPLSRIYGVASFYTQFRLQPVGKYVIDVCMGTACHVAGAPLVVEAFSQELEIQVGETTSDGLFTLQTVNCVGACALAPVVRIGESDTFGRVGPTEARRIVRKIRKQEAER